MSKQADLNGLPAQYKRALVRQGFERIGVGAFAEVFAKPGEGRVIRVSSGPIEARSRGGYDVDGWPHYIEWASRHGVLGTYAPTVTSFRTVRDRSGDVIFYVAVIERLQGTMGDAIREHLATPERPLPDAVDLIRRAMVRIAAGMLAELGDLAHYQVKVAAQCRLTDDAALPDDLEAFIAAFLEATLDGVHMQRDVFDLSNWMIRANGSPVLIDPWMVPIAGGLWPAIGPRRDRYKGAPGPAPLVG